MVITAAQIRAARALVGWTQAQLAAAASLSEISIQQIEKGLTDPRASTLAAIERAFEAAGVEFTNGGQPGVKLLIPAGHQPKPAVSPERARVLAIADRAEASSRANVAAEKAKRRK
jgi:transcriptional regulator with XRE-family HTH domain